MRKFFVLLIVSVLFTPLYAANLGPGGIEVNPAEIIRTGKLLPGRSLSRNVTKDFLTQIERSAKKVASLPSHSLTKGHPFPSTFQIQHTNNPLARAACGSVIGFKNNQGEPRPLVTVGGHVARDISKRNRLPYIRVQTEAGPIFIPIKKFFYGNPGGFDLAFADVPKELWPYITILEPAENTPVAGETVTFQGFLEEGNQPFTLQEQPVLFSTLFTALIKKTNEEDMMGTCGTPGFTNGKVSMIYIGYDDIENLPPQAWLTNLPEETQRSISQVHYAVPIDAVNLMAQSILETESTSQSAVMMKLLGRPVALLHPNESIVSVEQFRNGQSISKIAPVERLRTRKNIPEDDINLYAPIDPGQLELFFELEEGDILRVSLDAFTIEHPRPSVSIIYEVDVSTGQVAAEEPK